MTVNATPVTASTEPLDRDTDVKDYLRIDASDANENDVLDGLIAAARHQCEEELKRSLITQTRTLKLDKFPAATTKDPYAVVYLPFPPLVSITSVSYVDTSGTTQTLTETTDFVKHVDSDPSGRMGFITPAYGKTWPSCRGQKNAVAITYVAGYGGATDVPRSIRQGMLWLIGHMYENREAAGEKKIETLPMAVDRIWGPYRVEELY